MNSLIYLCCFIICFNSFVSAAINIVNKDSDKCITAFKKDVLTLVSCGGIITQKWAENGQAWRNIYHNACLETNNDGDVFLQHCDETNYYQKWEIAPMNNSITISSIMSGLFLSSTKGISGKQVVRATESGSNSEYWYIN